MCGKVFGRNDTLKRHMKMYAQKKEFQRSACTKTFHRRDIKLKHEASCFRKRTENELVEKVPPRNEIGGAFTTSEDSGELDDECQSALGGNVKSIQMKPRQNEKYDLPLFLQGERANVLNHLEKELKERRV